jgi:hypothetical protein
LKQAHVIVARLFLAAAGIAIILLMMPHESPTELTHLARTAHEGKLVFILSFPWMGAIPIPTYVFFTLIGVGAVLLLALSQSFKNFLSVARSQPRLVIPTILSLSILIISMLPPEPYFVSAGSSVVFILAASTLGLALAGTGLRPFMPSITGIFTRFSGKARMLIFESSHRVFLATCFMIFFSATNIISFAVFEHMPHVQDSISQVFHAKIFAQGHLTAPPPPEPEFFQFLQMIMKERWYSQYPPGHVLLLTPAMLLGLPWVVNPLLGSLSILLLYLLGKELYTEQTGRLAALLGLASPFLLFMSSEFMNHATALCFFLLFLLFVARAIRSGRMRHGLIAGAALGWVILTRPYSGAALALPLLLYGLVVLVRRGPSVWDAALGFAISLVLFLGILFGFNALTNGDPLVFGFQALWGEQVNPGFGALNAGEAHTPMKGITQTISTLNGLNKYLFEWPLPSLLFAAILFASSRRLLWDHLLLASAFSALAAYFFYWFHDWCFGPRFLYEAAGPLILLTARGILVFPDWSRDMLGTRETHEGTTVRLLGFVFVLVVIGFASNFPAHVRNYSNAYWGVDGTTLELVRGRGINRGIVFVPSAKFGSVFPSNDPFMQRELIFARDLGEANKELLRHFPSLPTYRIQRDSIVPLPLIP